MKKDVGSMFSRQPVTYLSHEFSQIVDEVFHHHPTVTFGAVGRDVFQGELFSFGQLNSFQIEQTILQII